MPSELQWAWIAGLFEGEGTIFFGGVNSVSVRIQMTDRDIIERLDELLPSPSGPLPVAPRRQGWKLSHLWLVSQRDSVQEFLVGIRPWMGERRGARVDEALERLLGCAGHNATKTHCPQGHAYTEDNTYVDGRGGRRCRTCNRDRQRVLRAAA